MKALFSACWKIIMDILYPPCCPACRKTVDAHGMWCPTCLQEVVAVREINLTEHRLQYMDGCMAVCEYTAGLRRIIRAMKFQRQKRYAIHLQWLLAYGLKNNPFPGVEVVIPVPLSTIRLKERGYNQAELIFHTWVENKRLSWWPQALSRVKNTSPQWELTLTKRRNNIKGAFIATHPETIRNRSILLVDDIITTGVTLNECAKVLKRAGVNKVYGLALASGAK